MKTIFAAIAGIVVGGAIIAWGASALICGDCDVVPFALTPTAYERRAYNMTFESGSYMCRDDYWNAWSKWVYEPCMPGNPLLITPRPSPTHNTPPFPSHSLLRLKPGYQCPTGPRIVRVYCSQMKNPGVAIYDDPPEKLIGGIYSSALGRWLGTLSLKQFTIVPRPTPKPSPRSECYTYNGGKDTWCFVEPPTYPQIP